MSLFSKLFGSSVSPEMAKDALNEGRRKMWNHEIPESRVLLDKALRAHPDRALVLAYLSLHERMRGEYHVPSALKLAREAVKVRGQSFEANAALLLALLTTNELVPALEVWLSLPEMEPVDAEGHWLRVVLYLLMIEVVENGEVREEAIDVTFEKTPLQIAATWLLDGYPDRAAVRCERLTAGNARNLMMGLTYYRLGRYDAARGALDSGIPGEMRPVFEYQVAVHESLEHLRRDL